MVQNSIYIGLSGQLSLARRMDALAQNMANVNTAGFRAQGLTFEQILAKKAVNLGDRPSFVNAGEAYLDTRPGNITKTSNPFDIAILNHKAWLAIQTPQGVVYSRDGRMNMTQDGQLVSVKGYNYLDRSGAPIQLDAKGPTPVITADGTIYQGNRPLGVLGLFQFPEGTKLHYAPNSSVTGDKAPLPIDDRNKVKISQGFIEGSNVNGVTEMTNLVTVSRTFEQMESLLKTQEDEHLEAIKMLGSID